jgi:hypothetical protein
MMARIKAPRNAFLNFPLGRQCGKPHDVEMQTRILKDALDVLVTATTPGQLADMPYQWDEPFDWPSFMKDVQEMLEQRGEPMQEWKPK